MYKRPRIIPLLCLDGEDLVKTIKFQKPRYLGDPVNAVKIFNNKFVDELCVLDIKASKEGRGPNFSLLEDIATEAFMPLSYGGGISKLEEIKKLFQIGFEKVIINTSFINNEALIKEAVEFAGSQSIVVALDVKTSMFSKKTYIKDGTVKTENSPLDLALRAEALGVGEILLNSIDKDGTMSGYDLDLIENISSNVSIPVIASGGASSIFDLEKALNAGASAVAAGSLFVYYGSKKAVLITTPTEEDLINAKIYQK
ncbi:MAG: AglZ/HisF2 family acetamidino modification protein [Bacilli bacterium]|nr:AglZ/HisF2 family acetamidino modification protein [Bacilli bacterium]